MRRSKAPLALMEQAVMLAVFALAAVLCLQAFVWANDTSRYISDADQALLQAQNAAEVLKNQGGDMAHALPAAAEMLGGRVEQGLWYILYDEDWQAVPDWEDAAFVLNVQGVPSGVEGLWHAEVWVSAYGGQEEALCSLPVAWQEVAYG